MLLITSVAMSQIKMTNYNRDLVLTSEASLDYSNTWTVSGSKLTSKITNLRTNKTTYDTFTINKTVQNNTNTEYQVTNARGLKVRYLFFSTMMLVVWSNGSQSTLEGKGLKF